MIKFSIINGLFMFFLFGGGMAQYGETVDLIANCDYFLIPSGELFFSGHSTFHLHSYD